MTLVADGRAPFGVARRAEVAGISRIPHTGLRRILFRNLVEIWANKMSLYLLQMDTLRSVLRDGLKLPADSAAALASLAPKRVLFRGVVSGLGGVTPAQESHLELESVHFGGAFESGFPMRTHWMSESGYFNATLVHARPRESYKSL